LVSLCASRRRRELFARQRVPTFRRIRTRLKRPNDGFRIIRGDARWFARDGSARDRTARRRERRRRSRERLAEFISRARASFSVARGDSRGLASWYCANDTFLATRRTRPASPTSRRGSSKRRLAAAAATLERIEVARLRSPRRDARHERVEQGETGAGVRRTVRRREI